MPSTKPNSPLAEFHTLTGHAGPVSGCQKCATVSRRQRSAAASFRSHRRQTAASLDLILRKAAR